MRLRAEDVEAASRLNAETIVSMQTALRALEYRVANMRDAMIEAEAYFLDKADGEYEDGAFRSNLEGQLYQSLRMARGCRS